MVEEELVNLGSELQNILRQYYDYLTIILRLSYDNAKVFVDLQ